MSSQLEELTEKWITSRFDALNEAGCEIKWVETSDEECGKPATGLVHAHSMTKHQYEQARICDECLTIAVNRGFLDPLLVCPGCETGPIITNIRRI